MLATRNLLYTAVTRGSKMVVLIGSEEAMNRMVDRGETEERRSALAAFLKDYAEKLS
jgi:exodeoxyribonuclease V alpha subunit